MKTNVTTSLHSAQWDEMRLQMVSKTGYTSLYSDEIESLGLRTGKVTSSLCCFNKNRWKSVALMFMRGGA
jgi:hypothetical protein